MRTLTTLLIGLLLVNCTTPVEPVYTYAISKELQPYVKEVLITLDYHDIQFKKQSFIVVFDADIMRTDTIGMAKGMDNDNLVYVIVNPILWGKLTVKQRRHLMFHELAHDIFNTEHTIEVELMRPSMATPLQSLYMDIDKEIGLLMKHIKATKL
tara:strand:- start:3242 stop:3703 length:462 start_codon:yes stop_codon:yes gene_type:complete